VEQPLVGALCAGPRAVAALR